MKDVRPLRRARPEATLTPTLSREREAFGILKQKREKK